MTESKPVYHPVDPEQLTPEEIRQLRFVLSGLSLHQLVQLVACIKQVCLQPGFGRITIVIEKGHPIEIEAGQRAKLLPSLAPEKLQELMNSYPADEGA